MCLRPLRSGRSTTTWRSKRPGRSSAGSRRSGRVGGAVADDRAGEAAGPQQRRVEDVGTVGRGDQDDVVLPLETVHLDQQLVQRLLALVVTAAHAGAAMPARRLRV